MTETSNAQPTSALPSSLPSSSEKLAPAPRALEGESNARQSSIAGSTTSAALQNGVSTSQWSVRSTLTATAAHAAASETLVGSSAPTIPLMQPIASHGGRASTASHLSDSSNHDGLGSSSPLSLLPPGPPIPAQYQALPQARHRHWQLTPRTHADPFPDPWTPNSTPTKYPLRLPTPQVSWRDRGETHLELYSQHSSSDLWQSTGLLETC